MTDEIKIEVPKVDLNSRRHGALREHKISIRALKSIENFVCNIQYVTKVKLYLHLFKLSAKVCRLAVDRRSSK